MGLLPLSREPFELSRLQQVHVSQTVRRDFVTLISCHSFQPSPSTSAAHCVIIFPSQPECLHVIDIRKKLDWALSMLRVSGLLALFLEL